MSKPTAPVKAPTPTKAPAKATPTPQAVGAAPAAEATDLLALTGTASVAEQADRLGNAVDLYHFEL